MIKSSLIKKISLLASAMIFSLSISGCRDNYKIKDELPIKNFVEISGQLQDNEIDTGRQGKIGIYDPVDKSLLEEILTDENGNFNLKLEKKPLIEIGTETYIRKVILQARLFDENNNPSSYVRTTILSREDSQNRLIRVVPYDGLKENSITPEQFIEFVKEVNLSMRKWNLNDFQGIEILNKNPLDGAQFTQEQQNNIEKIILDSDNSDFYFQGKPIKIQKDNPSTLESEKHYKSLEGLSEMDMDKNWIIVAPTKREDISGLGRYQLGDDSYKNSGIILLKNINELLVLHEFAHVLLGWHSKVLPPTLTVLYAPWNSEDWEKYGEQYLRNPGFADNKLALMLYEENYMSEEKLENILSMKFLPN